MFTCSFLSELTDVNKFKIDEIAPGCTIKGSSIGFVKLFIKLFDFLIEFTLKLELLLFVFKYESADIGWLMNCLFEYLLKGLFFYKTFILTSKLF